MITRNIISSVYKSFENFPVVGVLGSRQVGKTTLAKEIKKIYEQKAIYLDLELPSDINKLKDPELYLKQHFDDLVIIDEIQRMPELFPLIRALVDQNKRAGRFLVLGSASPDLLKNASESLAGRIIYHELNPFSLKEVGYDDISIKKLWLRGGYPDSFLAKDDAVSLAWREAFIRSHLERDIPQLGIYIPALQLRRFLTMVAHFNGQLWNSSKIANSLGVSFPTTNHYLDIFEKTFIIRRLQPYYVNIKKRLVKSPKVFIRDTGILHTVFGIQTFEDLQSYPLLGSSWEGFVIEQILAIMPNTWDAYFYRTSSGTEIDLLLLKDKTIPIAIEIKYSLTPKLSKGFYNACMDIGCKHSFIIYPGDETYMIDKNVQALSIQDISHIFL